MPPADPRAEQAPYRQVAAWFRDRIERGEMPAGQVLPSEKELMDEWQIGRSTARRAIALLRDEGYIKTVPQRGSYVAQR
jgi:GntR family transcriptional regulator